MDEYLQCFSKKGKVMFCGLQSSMEIFIPRSCKLQVVKNNNLKKLRSIEFVNIFVSELNKSTLLSDVLHIYGETDICTTSTFSGNAVSARIHFAKMGIRL